jgi:hypothetical protein
MTAAPAAGVIRVGAYALEVGADAGSFAQFETEREAENAQALAAALAEREEEATVTAAVEQLDATAEAVTTKIERAHGLFRAAVEGRLLDRDLVMAEIDELLRLSERLDRAKRFDEQLRLARALHGLLAVTFRWLDLIRSLRRAVRSAKKAHDRLGEAWARHEIGSLHLCAGDAKTAEHSLEQAARIQQRLGTGDWCATRHNLDSARRDLAGGNPPTPPRPQRGRLARRLAGLGTKGIAVLLIVLVAVSGGTVAAVASFSGHDEGLQPQVNHETLSFGASPVGETSTPETLSLQAGSSAITVRKIDVEKPEEFLIGGRCPSRLAPGTSCEIQVRFRPSAPGRRTTTLSIHLGQGGPLRVELVGTGIARVGASISPSALAFGELELGASSEPKTLNLSAGSKKLTIRTIASSDPREFRVTSHCPPTLAAEANCSIDVVFAPAATGTRTATITVDVGGGDEVRSPLTGVGIQPPRIRPAKADFARVVVGARKTTKLQLIAGTKSTTITGVRISDAKHFVATSTCQGPLPAGTHCAISVSFRPLAVRTYKALLTVSFSDRPSLTAPAIGVGIEAIIQLQPTRLDFGSVAHDMPDSVTKEVKLTNTGSAPLTIKSITSSDRQFSVKSNCRSTIAAGSHCSFAVTFNPSGGGHQSATITIDANGRGQHRLIAFGEGVVG